MKASAAKAVVRQRIFQQLSIALFTTLADRFDAAISLDCSAHPRDRNVSDFMSLHASPDYAMFNPFESDDDEG